MSETKCDRRRYIIALGVSSICFVLFVPMPSSWLLPSMIGDQMHSHNSYEGRSGDGGVGEAPVMTHLSQMFVEYFHRGVIGTRLCARVRTGATSTRSEDKPLGCATAGMRT